MLNVPLLATGKICSRCCCVLTTKPSRSTPNEPARVYDMTPRSLIVKKPSPLIARSRPRSVKSTPPCENSCVTDDIATPLPMFCAPTAKTSANSARDALKPVVFAFAMLLAVTRGPTTRRSDRSELLQMAWLIPLVG